MQRVPGYEAVSSWSPTASGGLTMSVARPFTIEALPKTAPPSRKPTFPLARLSRRATIVSGTEQLGTAGVTLSVIDVVIAANVAWIVWSTRTFANVYDVSGPSDTPST